MKENDFSNLLSLNLGFVVAQVQAIKKAIDTEPQTAKTKASNNKKIDNLASFLKSLKTLN